jgi:hypothetical protein
LRRAAPAEEAKPSSAARPGRDPHALERKKARGRRAQERRLAQPRKRKRRRRRR